MWKGQEGRYVFQTPLQPDKPDVRVALDSQTQDTVVVKVLPRADQGNAERHALELLHGAPNIVSMRDSYFTNSIHGRITHVVLDFAEHGNLLDYLMALPSQRLSEERAAPLMRQIVTAVAACHSACFAHGDLKLNNVLIDSDGRLLLCDFSMANFVPPDTIPPFRSNKCSGTPAYASPALIGCAQSEGKESYDPFAADIWALGVMLFVMLTGTLPFERENTERMLAAIVRQPLKLPSDVTLSPSCESLVRSMLAKQDHARPSIAAVQRHKWLGG